MRKGFIFNINKCAGCRSCVAACHLENGWSINARNVFVANEELADNLPVRNISLACNHCEKPVCLEGCPAGSYSKDKNSGAIILNENRCMGCRYCEWNCPYGAPKFDNKLKIIGKCNLCYKGLAEGRLPACVNACPTGALSFGDIDESAVVGMTFPQKDLGPSFNFTGTLCEAPLRIIPENRPGDIKIIKDEAKTPEWSLVLFSFLATISVSVTLSLLLKGIFPGIYSLILLFATGLASLFHLGKMLRAWRALTNLKSSPLSREILAFMIYGGTLLITILSGSIVLLIISSITGTIFLVTIDTVYRYADRRKSIVLHSGQTFLTFMIIVSFLSGNIFSFIFIAVLKVFSMIYLMHLSQNNDKNNLFRIFRIAILLLVCMYIIISGKPDIFITMLFLLGELFDRILYYIDFEPISIKKQINNLIQ
jgi:Fe-S-cluster-containing dehydrogenase component/DMSO reductase anchor subunit